MHLCENRLEVAIARALGKRSRVAVATTAVSPDVLSPGELSRYEALTFADRRCTWLLGRTALKHVLRACGQSSDSSTLSFPNRHFSITHSGDYAVAIGIETDDMAGVGVDFEVHRAPHPESARFFLTDQECDWLKGESDVRRPAHLLRLWTVKEAVFKADPCNHRTGLKDYQLEAPELYKGRAFPGDGRALNIVYLSFYLAEGYLSVAVATEIRSSHVNRK